MENYLIKCPNCGNDVSVALEFPITTNFSQKCNRCNATITGSCSWNMHTGSVSFSSVKFYKKVVCPNCGQIASNNKNCEHCGSLLVRFPSLGIDLSDTAYLTNDHVIPGLIEPLNNWLYYYVNDKYFCYDPFLSSSVFRAPSIRLFNQPHMFLEFDQGDHMLEIGLVYDGSRKRLRFTGFRIDVNTPIILKNLNNLVCYPLLTTVKHEMPDEPMMGCEFTENYIDCGKDVEGTARIASDIIRNIFKITNSDSIWFVEDINKSYFKVVDQKDAGNASNASSAGGAGCLLGIIAVIVLPILLIV